MNDNERNGLGEELEEADDDVPQHDDGWERIGSTSASLASDPGWGSYAISSLEWG